MEAEHYPNGVLENSSTRIMNGTYKHEEILQTDESSMGRASEAGGVKGNKRSGRRVKIVIGSWGKNMYFGFLSPPQWMKFSRCPFHGENESVLELKPALAFHSLAAVLLMLWSRESNRSQRFVQHWSWIPAQSSPGTSSSWGTELSCERLADAQPQSVLSTVWSATTVLFVGDLARRMRMN